jgi:hypothetical protein
MKALLASIGAATIAFSAPASGAGAILFAGGSWAAIDRGNACVALTRAVRIAAKGKVQATAGFSFTPDRRRWGEFHARLSHLPRPGSTVLLTVGDQPFLLVAGNGWAWSRGAQQEQAIIAAIRNSGGMRVEGRDVDGGRFADRYELAGAPTAIDAAAARCASLSAGKIQPH